MYIYIHTHPPLEGLLTLQARESTRLAGARPRRGVVLGFPAPERLPLWSFSGAARLQVGCCGAPRPRAVGGPRAPAGRGDPFGHHGVRPLGDPGNPRVRGDPKGKKKERARGPAGSGSSGLGCSRPSGVSPGVYFVGRGRHRDLLFFPVYAGHLDVVWCLGGWSSSAWRTVTTARGISSGSGDRGTGMPICVLGVGAAAPAPHLRRRVHLWARWHGGLGSPCGCLPAGSRPNCVGFFRAARATTSTGPPLWRAAAGWLQREGPAELAHCEV